MYNTVLVPLDGSKRAEAILPHVEQILLPGQGKIVLLRVVEPPFMPERDEVADLSKFHKAFEDRKREAMVYLEKIKQEFEKKGAAMELRITVGPVVSVILNIASEINADVIAMSSHGFGGSERMFYGSTAAGILQRVDRPLLIIRTRRL